MYPLSTVKEMNKQKKVEQWLQNSTNFFDSNPCKKPKIIDEVQLEKKRDKTSAGEKISSSSKQIRKKKQESQIKITKKALLCRSESVPTKMKDSSFKKIKEEKKPFVKIEIDDEDFVGSSHCKPSTNLPDVNVNNIKKEIKSLPKIAMRPASFILKPTTSSCIQTDIDSSNIRDLLKYTDKLPDQLKSNVHYRFTINLDNDRSVHKREVMLNDSKQNDLEPWFGHLIDNYRSKYDYGGEEGYSCFITLDSRFKVMLSINNTEMVASNVEVLTDGSNEDNWMRNIRDPVRIFNWIEKQIHAHTLESMELVNLIPDIIVTRIFPPEC